MSNSPLVNFTQWSPNCTRPRNHAIDTLTIHCVSGQATVESLGTLFAQPSRQASSQYGVGYDGRIGQYVDEANRSWCSSSESNDHRAITIEVASDNFHPYAVTDAAYASAIRLAADICKRNPGIGTLKWKADPALVGNVAAQNMTAHRWFANKACPGDFLYARFGDIAAKANALNASAAPAAWPVHMYRPNNTDAQLWRRIDAGDGWCYLQSKTGRFLDIAGASKESGARVQVYTGNGTDAQKFKLVPATDIAYYPVPPMLIVPKVNESLVLDVKGGSVEIGAEIWTYPRNNTNAQKWTIADKGNGYFCILDINGLQALDVKGAGKG